MKATPIVLVVSLCALGLGRCVSGGELTSVVEESRLKGGVILLVSAGSAIYDEAAATGCTVRGLETDQAVVDALRKRFLARGIYGKLSVSGFDGKTIPEKPAQETEEKDPGSDKKDEKDKAPEKPAIDLSKIKREKSFVRQSQPAKIVLLASTDILVKTPEALDPCQATHRYDIAVFVDDKGFIEQKRQAELGQRQHVVELPIPDFDPSGRVEGGRTAVDLFVVQVHRGHDANVIAPFDAIVDVRALPGEESERPPAQEIE